VQKFAFAITIAKVANKISQALLLTYCARPIIAGFTNVTKAKKIVLS
jgi:hypothetical protein